MSKLTWHFSRLFILIFLPLGAQAEIEVNAAGVVMSPPDVTDFYSMEVRVVGPEGAVYHDTSYGEVLVWDCTGCADGNYSVETRTAVLLGEVESDEGPQPALQVDRVETARFQVQGGVAVATESPDSLGTGQSRVEERALPLQRFAAAVLNWLMPSAQAADLTASSIFPSVNFDDTSSTFVGNEFRLYCQGGDATSAGNECWFTDLEHSQNMWYVQSEASLLRIGIGTSAPSASLHIATPQDPRILLDDTSTDFEIGINASNDVAFSFVSNSGGPTGQVLTIENDLSAPSLYPGVGIWSTNPAVPLQVGSPNGQEARIDVRNSVQPPAGDRVMFQLANVGGANRVRFAIDAGAGDTAWTFDNDPFINSGSGVRRGQFRISKIGTGVAEFTVDGFGNGRFSGISYALTHVNTSSRDVKAGFTPVDPKSVLESVATLPISTWHYRAESPDALHLGPVAEDFQQHFGLGDGKHIATVDQGGVALAAIQGLYQVVHDKQTEIADLKAENAQYEAILESLAERLEALETKSGLTGPAR